MILDRVQVNIVDHRPRGLPALAPKLSSPHGGGEIMDIF
jgi:hypothetical protein